jgi:hypothetical protein
MDLKEAVAIAKREVGERFTPAPQSLRLEEYLYDDHLGVWSLTIGFALPGRMPGAADTAPPGRCYKIVRVAQADKSILSVRDR